ncbi:MAG: TPM domain-containing protein [Chthoniobacterales bacterium]
MRTHEFLDRVDHDRVVEAIKAAEGQTSGEIRVFVHRGELNEDPYVYAQSKFNKLCLHKTRERNGVLVFVAPRAQKFAVLGDEGIHAKVGDVFWQQLVEKMREHFKQEHFTEALVDGIGEVAKLLAQFFPRRPDDKNELPDEIVVE